MAKAFRNSSCLLRQSFAVAAETVNAQSAEGGMRKASELTEVGGKDAKKEVYWMRDPKTGVWMPETHEEELDAADLRAIYLSKKNNS